MSLTKVAVLHMRDWRSSNLSHTGGSIVDLSAVYGPGRCRTRGGYGRIMEFYISLNSQSRSLSGSLWASDLFSCPSLLSADRILYRFVSPQPVNHFNTSTISDLPSDIWYHIAEFLPDNVLQHFFAVNSMLHHLALNARYREITVEDLGSNVVARKLLRLR